MQVGLLLDQKKRTEMELLHKKNKDGIALSCLSSRETVSLLLSYRISLGITKGIERSKSRKSKVSELSSLSLLLFSSLILFFSSGAPRGGRGAPRGGARGGRGGAKGGSNVIVKPHRHEGIFIAEGKEHLLVTKNLSPGDSVYGEKRISVEGAPTEDGLAAAKIEYRVWNPFRSKLAAGVLGGLDHIYIAPGKKVLYLGAASGTSVSHVADIVGPEGTVYAVEFSHRSGRDLINMAKKRTNVIRESIFPHPSFSERKDRKRN